MTSRDKSVANRLLSGVVELPQEGVTPQMVCLDSPDGSQKSHGGGGTALIRGATIASGLRLELLILMACTLCLLLVSLHWAVKTASLLVLAAYAK